MLIAGKIQSHIAVPEEHRRNCRNMNFTAEGKSEMISLFRFAVVHETFVIAFQLFCLM